VDDAKRVLARGAAHDLAEVVFESIRKHLVSAGSLLGYLLRWRSFGLRSLPCSNGRLAAQGVPVAARLSSINVAAVLACAIVMADLSPNCHTASCQHFLIDTWPSGTTSISIRYPLHTAMPTNGASSETSTTTSTRVPSQISIPPS